MELPVSYTSRKSVEYESPRSPAQLSSEGLSSPPRSSPEVASPSRRIINKILSTPAPSTSLSSVTSSTQITTKLDTQSEKPLRKPRRKLKDSTTSLQPKNTKGNTQTGHATTSAGSTEAPKPKRVRKLKDPNAPPAQRRKKNVTPAKTNESGGDSKENETIKLHSPSSKPISNPNSVSILSSQLQKGEESQPPTQSFFGNDSSSQAQVQLQAETVRKSGQKYDPIRCSNYDPVRETLLSHNSSNNTHDFQSKSSKIGNASTTLSISSLVDPQSQQLSSMPPATQSFFNHSLSKLALADSHSAPVSPNLKSRDPSTVSKSTEISKSTKLVVTYKKSESTGSLSLSKKIPSTSPKQTKNRDAKEVQNTINPIPPPLPGSGNESNNVNEYRAPTVILRIPINGEVNKYVNFTRLAEQQYGWDALHPRLAAQRDRLARVAAAGAALERNGSNKDSGDEMSLDSEGEGSNVEMGGMSDGRTGVDFVKKVPKKRKMREDEYDKDDGFVDDTELLWEEQAAATNDGFFVYSGPLIPEGDKTGLDTKSDGASRRGRGRGNRGGASRGSTTRGGATSANTSVRNNLPASGPGSRGGIGARKPRVTKADRARMEQEKLEREKVGLVSTPSGLNNAGQPAKASSEGNFSVLINR